MQICEKMSPWDFETHLLHFFVRASFSSFEQLVPDAKAIIFLTAWMLEYIFLHKTIIIFWIYKALEFSYLFPVFQYLYLEEFAFAFF